MASTAPENRQVRGLGGCPRRRQYKIESQRGMVRRYTLVQAEALPFVMRVVMAVHIAAVGTANVVQARRYCPSQSFVVPASDKGPARGGQLYL